MGLVVRADASEGVGVVQLQTVVFWLVRGAAALVQLLLTVPLHPNWHPTVWTRVLEAVLDRTLTADPVARVVVAKRLLDSPAFFGTPGTFRSGAMPMAEGRMMRMLGPVGGVRWG